MCCISSSKNIGEEMLKAREHIEPRNGLYKMLILEIEEVEDTL